MDMNLVIVVIFAIIAISSMFVVLYCFQKRMMELIQIIYNHHPAPKKEVPGKRHTSLADKQRKEMDNQRRE